MPLARPLAALIVHKDGVAPDEGWCELRVARG